MTDSAGRDARRVPGILEREAASGEGEAPASWLARVVRARRNFGITRIGSITRLDRIGLPVVQVVRPLALSNAVALGKGPDAASATASALMEAVETWAAERVPSGACRQARAAALGAGIAGLYDPWTAGSAQADWAQRELSWVEGWDLLGAAPVPVPLALVDTAYLHPSPHPSLFPRVTTGLGAGARMTDAVVQAGLEILERDALARARRVPYVYERFQLDLTGTGLGAAAGAVLARIRGAGLLAGAWRLPAGHGLPVYRCHVMEDEGPLELAPMPAEGTACRLAPDDALAAALLEACQARLAAISGAREDITRDMYPQHHDREALGLWREGLRTAGPLSAEGGSEASGTPLARVLAALAAAGARAAIVVPLFRDASLRIAVVRMVAPPLRLWPGGAHG